MTIDLMQKRDAGQVAALHAATITEGFLLRLGRRFLRQMYLGVAEDEHSVVYVARAGDRVLGFCAYSEDVSAMYKRVLRSRWWRLGWASVPNSLNPFVLKEVLDTLRYPAKQAAVDLPPAEILSIGVDASTRGGGVGRKLLDRALEHARAAGQTRVKVLAGAKLAGANAFYQRYGFSKLAELTQHGEVLNVYVIEMGE